MNCGPVPRTRSFCKVGTARPVSFATWTSSSRGSKGIIVAPTQGNHLLGSLPMFGGTCTPSKVCFFVPSMAVLASHQQLLDLLAVLASHQQLLDLFAVLASRPQFVDLFTDQCHVPPRVHRYRREADSLA